MMFADSVHGCIGRKLKKESTLGNLNDYFQLIKSARSNMTVNILTHRENFSIMNLLRHKVLRKSRVSKLQEDLWI